ncbi:hypothetical protein [Streptomyces caatingaensis]|uniref:Uncharacterized protein n=1 Tax=Streptomyces caatingaensis TaxID=1678637 RepID=A0A0K9XJL8_9ACTN|nr:hypothetical protein [Streptomyces caatingaensis]KNB52852.1 hypothetical protein AC230_09455 [Streptomyces caatingaensis]
MPPIPVKPGIYKVHTHLIGPGMLVTATEHAVKHGAPLIVDRPYPVPFEQEWAVVPAEPVPGSPYVFHLAYEDRAGIVIAEDKIWVNNVPREEWAKFTFEKVIGGVKILSDKGLAWRAPHRGAQTELVPPKPEFQETWTLEFIRPVEGTE